MNLKINDMVFNYASKNVLEHVSLELNDSEIVAVIGPNGAGKSTLIKCINRVLKPQGGTIRYREKDLEKMSRMEIAQHFGYVPQSTVSPFPATVFDTVLMGRRPHSGWRFSSSDIEKTFKIMALVGIKDLAMRDFTELSGGQQQKVVLARALVQETDTLLLDEPTSSLDIKQQLEIMEILRSLVLHKGLSVIMVIHDLNLAAQYVDRIIMMKNGCIYAIGTPFAVLNPYNIEVVFGVGSVVKEEGGKPYIILKYPSKTDLETVNLKRYD